MLKIENITKIYNKGTSGECIAIKDFSLNVEDGEMLAIIGRTGSGKSTLLHLLCGLDSPTDGKIIIDEKNIREFKSKELALFRNKFVGIVMQDYALVNCYSVIDNVMLPMIGIRMKKKEKKAKCLALLEKLSMVEYAKKSVKKLSGGQKQRVAIARALINEPKLLICDEPTGALDEKTAGEIMQLLKDINSHGKTMIIITHDPVVYNNCSRVITMSAPSNQL